jgi:LCP family protein required for cell wall assembly
VLGLSLAGASTCALALRTDTGQHVAARMVRETLGPPEPLEPPLDEDPPGTESRRSPPVAQIDVQTPGPAGLGPATPGPSPAPPPPPAKPRGLRNVSFVLLLGMDNRTAKVTGRTDTMVIAGFRHRDGKVGAFSVPRDMWVEDPELGPMRISSAVRVANMKLGAGKGVPFLRRVIEREFGIRIDRYAAVDLAGFVDVVEQLGGIDVDVQCPIEDCLRMAEGDETCEALSLPAGRQTMDGRTALKFARSRHGRGDLDRRRRQQALLIGFARAARAQGLADLRDLWETVDPFVRSDLDWKAAAYYGSFAIETDLADLHGFSIAKKMVRKHVTDKQQHVLLVDRDLFDAALADMFADTLPGLRPRKSCPDPDAAFQARARR